MPDWREARDVGMDLARRRRRRAAVPLLEEALAGCRAEQQNASPAHRASLRVTEATILGVLVQVLPLDAELDELVAVMEAVLELQAGLGGISHLAEVTVPGMPLVATSLADVLERRRATLPDDERRVALLDASAPILDRLVELLLATGHPDAALVAAERARGRALADLLTGATHSPVDASSAPLSIDGIHDAVRATGTVVLTYHFVADAGNAWTVDVEGTVRHRRLPAGVATLTASLAALRDERGELRPAVVDRLHAQLIAPVAADLPAPGEPVTVVPHGPAHRVPFAAVLTQWPVALLPSIATAPSHPWPPVASPPRLLALVAPTMPRSAPTPLLALSDLDAAAPALAAPFPGAVVRSGPEATLEALRDHAADAEVILLGTHAHADDEDPAQSFVALAPTSDHDGLVRLDDLTALRLQARLVVLLACRTGAGRITGDGVVGISRAFLAAGAQAVVATLWDAGERTTRRLVQDLLVLWSRGSSPVEALHGAQRRARDRFGPDQPARWAGVVVYHGVVHP